MSLSKLSRIWLWFALSTLLLASLMALVLVLSKMPFLPAQWSLERFFPWALVFHVDLSILVWALSVASLLWMRYLPVASAWPDRLSTGLMLVAAVGLLIALSLGQGRPLLSNYIPVLDAPLFLISLGVFVLAVVVIALARVWSWLFCFRRERRTSYQVALLLAAFALLVSVAVWLLAWHRLPFGAFGLRQAEMLFWGAGHSLQAVYLLLLLGGWLLLMSRSGALSGRWLTGIPVRIGLKLMIGVIVVPLLIALFWAPNDADYRGAFTTWMRLFSVPLLAVIVLFGGRLFGAVVLRQETGYGDRRLSWRGLAVVLSMLLFLLGVVVGSLIRGDSLLVPAHYHATTAAVNLIFMALIYDWLMARSTMRLVRLQLQTYAVGVWLMVMGLAFSGLMGMGRKLAATEQVLDNSSGIAAMLLVGAGGVVGLLGLFWFIGMAMRQASRLTPVSVPHPVNRGVSSW